MKFTPIITALLFTSSFTVNAATIPQIDAESVATAKSAEALQSKSQSDTKKVVKYPPALIAFMKRNNKDNPGFVTVSKSFDTGIKGVNGFVLKVGIKQAVIYEYDNKLIIGSFINESGVNLTLKHEAEHVPKPDMNKIVKEIEAATYIQDGGDNGSNVVYVFLEPNCGHCRTFHEKASPLVDANKLTVKYVPVSFLTPESDRQLAYILGADNPAKALRDFYKGKPLASAAVTKRIREKLSRNSMLMQKAGFQGTPALIIKKNGKWVALPGMPRNLEVLTIKPDEVAS